MYNDPIITISCSSLSQLIDHSTQEGPSVSGVHDPEATVRDAIRHIASISRLTDLQRLTLLQNVDLYFRALDNPLATAHILARSIKGSGEASQAFSAIAMRYASSGDVYLALSSASEIDDPHIRATTLCSLAPIIRPQNPVLAEQTFSQGYHLVESIKPPFLRLDAHLQVLDAFAEMFPESEVLDHMKYLLCDGCLIFYDPEEEAESLQNRIIENLIASKGVSEELISRVYLRIQEHMASGRGLLLLTTLARHLLDIHQESAAINLLDEALMKIGALRENDILVDQTLRRIFDLYSRISDVSKAVQAAYRCESIYDSLIAFDVLFTNWTSSGLYDDTIHLIDREIILVEFLEDQNLQDYTLWRVSMHQATINKYEDAIATVHRIYDTDLKNQAISDVFDLCLEHDLLKALSLIDDIQDETQKKHLNVSWVQQAWKNDQGVSPYGAQSESILQLLTSTYGKNIPLFLILSFLEVSISKGLIRESQDLLSLAPGDSSRLSLLLRVIEHQKSDTVLNACQIILESLTVRIEPTRTALHQLCLAHAHLGNHEVSEMLFRRIRWSEGDQDHRDTLIATLVKLFSAHGDFGRALRMVLQLSRPLDQVTALVSMHEAGVTHYRHAANESNPLACLVRNAVTMSTSDTERKLDERGVTA
ncbi:MAG: hypothetical protein JXK93_07815 [Sphaerochaetaceae bacterium]|nr:hypothetical protein [Sphaerochaetaceae bacterium]